MTVPTTPLEVALQLASAGHRVFPCDAETRKPLVKWGSDACSDPAVLAEWFGQWPDAMPAIALPRDLLVFDIDPRNDGAASARALPDGALPDTAAVRTARGGLHLYYTVPPGHSLKNVTGLRSGIDVKTAGGFVIAPGAIRADGLEYTALTTCGPAPAPGWLLHECRRTDGDAVADAPATRAPAGSELEQAMAGGIAALLASRLTTDGARHATALAVGNALAGEGWSDAGIAAVVGDLPSTDPAARVRDALDAAAAVRAGTYAAGFGGLERVGYAPGTLAAVRTMATGGAWDELAENAARAAAVTVPTDGQDRAATEDALEAELTKPVRAQGYRLGFGGLDGLIEDGVTSGDTIVLGGEGDAGKTQLQLQIENELRAQGVAIVHVAADEERERVVLRQAQTLLDLHRGELAEPSFDSQKVRLKPSVRDALKVKRAGWGPIVYVDDPLLDQTAERAVLDFKTKGFEVALCVDSGQTVSVSNAPADRRAQVDAVIARWRSICRGTATACIGVLTSETGRSFYKGAKQRPDNLMAAFKESGSIEYAARFAVVLEPGDTEGEVVAHIVKNKLGGRKGRAYFKRTAGLLRMTDAPAPVPTPADETEAVLRACIRREIENANGRFRGGKSAMADTLRASGYSRDDVRAACQRMQNAGELFEDSAKNWSLTPKAK